jgi:hypothetical protein
VAAGGRQRGAPVLDAGADASGGGAQRAVRAAVHVPAAVSKAGGSPVREAAATTTTAAAAGATLMSPEEQLRARVVASMATTSGTAPPTEQASITDNLLNI